MEDLGGQKGKDHRHRSIEEGKENQQEGGKEEQRAAEKDATRYLEASQVASQPSLPAF